MARTDRDILYGVLQRNGTIATLEMLQDWIVNRQQQEASQSDAEMVRYWTSSATAISECKNTIKNFRDRM